MSSAENFTKRTKLSIKETESTFSNAVSKALDTKCKVRFIRVEAIRIVAETI